MKLKDMFDLTRKVAIVTGGGRGIGKFIATGIAEAGANLVIASRKVENCEKGALVPRSVNIPRQGPRAESLLAVR